jgi:hypothetical protein
VQNLKNFFKISNFHYIVVEVFILHAFCIAWAGTAATSYLASCTGKEETVMGNKYNCQKCITIICYKYCMDLNAQITFLLDISLFYISQNDSIVENGPTNGLLYVPTVCLTREMVEFIHGV